MIKIQDEIPIPKSFEGKTIFITGGSGFMGKVLIEKLLRSCPAISAIYVLIRNKRNKEAQERLKIITESPLFDRVKKEQPQNMEKIIPVFGDVTNIGLGLSPESRKLLTEKVNVIFHAAASVRFDDTLRDAIILNTRGVREVVHLAEEMKQLDLLLHVSTTYCHTDKQVIEEKAYPPYADWRKAIELAENGDPHILNILTPHYINPFPNTYTFTKRLAEDIVTELCEGRIPAIIFRPSIVVSSSKEPVPGWTDNFNGPVGLLTASGKGILKSVYVKPNLISDYIPVDVAIKCLIIVSWVKMMEKNKKDKLTLSVYNASNNNVNNVTISEIIEMGKKIAWEVPLENVLWYPTGGITYCYYNHFLKIIFFHILPALFIDGLLKITGHKPLLLKIQRKIFIANMALQYFLSNQWTFINDKCLYLEENLLAADRIDFVYGREIKPYEYFKNAAVGAKKFLLKENTDNMEKAKAHTRRMYKVHVIFNILWYCALFSLLIFKLDIAGLLRTSIEKAYLYYDRS